jgi:hypothetical protein
MNRLLAVILGAGQPRAPRPSDRDYGLGTCRWCLNIVTPRSSAWVRLATGHAACLESADGCSAHLLGAAAATGTGTMGPAVARRYEPRPDRLDARDHRRRRLDNARGHRGRAGDGARTARREHTAVRAMAFAAAAYPAHPRRL